MMMRITKVLFSRHFSWKAHEKMDDLYAVCIQLWDCFELENFSDKLRFSSKIVNGINSHTPKSKVFMSLTRCGKKSLEF